jgi:isopenicillin-N epimerase
MKEQSTKEPMMPSRRQFAKASILSAAAPWLPQWNLENPRPRQRSFPFPDDPEYWKKIRAMFLIPEGKAFFNTGTLGAQPAVVLEAVFEHMRKVATDIADWDYKGDDWITGYQPYRTIRAKLAALMNATAEEISLAENAHSGMNIIANGLDLQPGDEILGTDMEHPGGRYGWESRAKRCKGVYRQIPLPKPPRDPGEIVELFRSACTAKTKVLAVPHIVSGTGAILPAKELCAEAGRRGIFTILDGAQALGHIKVDVRDIGCDAYYSSMHKWLCAPAGNGVLYVRKERARDIWTTLASAQWENHEDEGYRLQQRGTGNLSLLVGLDAALAFHSLIGPDRVVARIKELGDYLRAGLKNIPGVTIHTPLHPAMCAGITNYAISGASATEMQDALWTRGLRIRGNRHSTHIYNSKEEIDAALVVLRGLVKA